MTPQTVVSDTPEALAEQAAQAFLTLVKHTLTERPRFTVALSGGATPKMFYSRLTQEPYRSEIPWDKIWFFWGDERCVPPEHSESNFRMAKEALLEKVPVPSAHVFRIRGEDPPTETGRSYARMLHDYFKMDGDWPAFDLILLGMGADGHTASLMPNTAALDEERRWVVENVVRTLQTVRVTITLPVINHARNVWFLVTGAKKAGAYARVRTGPSPEFPASLVQPQFGQLIWYIDKAVAGASPPSPLPMGEGS